MVELRILGWQEREGWTRDRSGFFDYDHLQHLAAEALKYTGQSEGTYWTLNPVDPALLARAENKTKVTSQKGKATSDQHVLRRRWLLIDCDPQRPAGISSTDSEKEFAHRAILAIRDHLREDAGWPAPILADSGNGYHLLYRIDLSADDGGLVQRCLQALGSRFDTDRVKVDTSVFNPSRICKLYGTQARKGDSTQNRPHRWARVLEIPEPVELVRAELLEALAVEAAETARAKSEPSRNGHAASANGDNHRLDVARWLTDRGLGFTRDRLPDGTDRYRLDHCPFNPEHVGKEVAIFQYASGATHAKCFHNSCQGKGWKEFKGAIGPPDPNHYDPPLRHRHSEVKSGRGTEPPKTPAAERTVSDLVRLADLDNLGRSLEWVWEGWMLESSLCLVAATAGHGKTRFATDLVRRIVHGQPWPDGKPMQLPRDAAVLWVAADHQFAELNQLHKDFGLGDHVYLNSYQDNPLGGTAVDSAEDLAALADRIDLAGAKLVIIDTLGNATGRDLCSQHEAKELAVPLMQLAVEKKIVVLLLYHLNREGKPLGRRMVERCRTCLLLERQTVPKTAPSRSR